MTLKEWLWEPRSRKQIKVYLVVAAVWTIGFWLVSLRGCVEEAGWDLAAVSPFPRWIMLPSGVTPADVTVHVAIILNRDELRLTVRDKAGHELMRVESVEKELPSGGVKKLTFNNITERVILNSPHNGLFTVER